MLRTIAKVKPDLPSNAFYARQRRAALRRLDSKIAAEKSPVVRNRIRIIRWFVEGRMTAEQIARRAGMSRTTAFAYWHEYRMSGLENLVRVQPNGRPCAMPAIVRQRFEHLAQPDPHDGTQVMVYVVEREQLVFRILGSAFPLWKINRWLKQYVREHHLADRTYRFRTIRAAFPRLPERDRLLYSGHADVHLSWEERLLAEALGYASDLKPDDRELCRWALAVRFDVSRTDVAFNDEPGREVAVVVWNAPASTSASELS